MKKLCLLFISMCFLQHLYAQKDNAGAAVKKPVVATLKKIQELQMPRTTDDDYPGTRGASVTWHPVQKKYYAAMAGNSLYPLAVFNVTGKRLSDEFTDCKVDTRGLWYDVSRKAICGNAYGNIGWFVHNLDNTGLPVRTDTIYIGQNQPTDQCVGAYNAKDRKILFLDGSIIYSYDASTAEVSPETIQIHWGRTKKEGPSEDEFPEETYEGYNYTTIVYTGLPGSEIGVLNHYSKQIELYDIKDGFLKKTFKLPQTAVTYEIFNFAYANGIYWLFNQETRKWVGYK